MKEFLEIMQTWSGIFLLLVLAVIGIVCTLAGSSSGEERRLSGKDDDHYVLRLPVGRVVYPLALLVAGVVLQFVGNYLQTRFFGDQVWIPLAIKLAAAVIFGLLFWTQLAKVLRRRVFINGDKIIVTPAIGAPIETTYKQIRTVANKLAGKDRGVIGKKIRTKEGNRFEVINTMAGYERFCEQLSEKVELPDLTKKLFKKRDKKNIEEPEPEEAVSQEPLPQASPTAQMPEAVHAGLAAAGNFLNSFANDKEENVFGEDVSGAEAAPETQEEGVAEAAPEIQEEGVSAVTPQEEGETPQEQEEGVLASAPQEHAEASPEESVPSEGIVPSGEPESEQDTYSAGDMFTGNAAGATSQDEIP